MTPFEALCGRSFRSPTCLLDNKDPVLVELEIIEQTIKIAKLIGKRMKKEQDSQKPYADLHRMNLEKNMFSLTFHQLER